MSYIDIVCPILIWDVRYWYDMSKIDMICFVVCNVSLSFQIGSGLVGLCLSLEWSVQCFSPSSICHFIFVILWFHKIGWIISSYSWWRHPLLVYIYIYIYYIIFNVDHVFANPMFYKTFYLIWYFSKKSLIQRNYFVCLLNNTFMNHFACYTCGRKQLLVKNQISHNLIIQ